MYYEPLIRKIKINYW